MCAKAFLGLCLDIKKTFSNKAVFTNYQGLTKFEITIFVTKFGFILNYTGISNACSTVTGHTKSFEAPCFKHVCLFKHACVRFDPIKFVFILYM